MSENPSSVAIPLPPQKKRMVQWGCIALMLSIGMFGLSLATLQEPILAQMDALSYFSLLSILSSLGLSIMTPIGGKLGDLFGRRNLIIVSGLICAICAVGMGFIRVLLPFMLLRLFLGAAQGAFTAAPYILAREINEPKDVPKMMGLLASAVAAGGFGGSIIAGFLTDLGLLELAIIFPVIPLLVGVGLIAYALPNQRRQAKVNIDIIGILLLSVTLTGILLGLNFGPREGWTNPLVLGGLTIGIIALLALLRAEKTAKEPLIPLHLFRNRAYVALLLLGFLCYFYNTAMNYYTPLAVQQVLGESTTVAGSLQMPRTILTIALPTICGIWVAKQRRNSWIAMAASAGLTAVAFLALGFTNSQTSVLLYYGALALTGIGESLRSVSITPTLQSTLPPEELGVGTSLSTFINSLSNLLASVIFGLIYDILTASDPSNINNITTGVNSVFLFTALVAASGVALTLLLIRPYLERK